MFPNMKPNICNVFQCFQIGNVIFTMFFNVSKHETKYYIQMSPKYLTQISKRKYSPKSIFSPARAKTLDTGPLIFLTVKVACICKCHKKTQKQLHREEAILNTKSTRVSERFGKVAFLQYFSDREASLNCSWR